jgi:hypothetical protein
MDPRQDHHQNTEIVQSIVQLGSAWAHRDGYCRSPKGGDPDFWPEELRVRQMPRAAETVSA